MQRSTKILLATAVALVLVVAGLICSSSTVFFQLFIALALAYILNPAVNVLERKGLPRIPGILVVFCVTLVAFTAGVAFMVTSVSQEFSSIQLNLPGYAQRIYEVIPPAAKSHLGIETPERLSLRLDELIQQARTSTPDLLKPLAAILKQAFSSTIGFVLALLGYLIIPVYLFYMLADFGRLKQFLESYVPERFRPGYNSMLAEIDTVLSGFIRGQLTVCAILALLYSIGLYLIGIDLAIAIGTLAGAAFIIPYVGTVLGICLSILMALLKYHDILHPLLCLGWFGLVQALEGTVITPRIVGTSVGLHPLVAIVALLIGGQIFGLSGMLLAVPVSAVLQVFLRSLSAWYRTTEFYLGRS